jgi:hypothetical protein
MSCAADDSNKHDVSIFRAEMCKGSGQIIQTGGRTTPMMAHIWPYSSPPPVALRDLKFLPLLQIITSNLKLEAVCSSETDPISTRCQYPKRE